MNHKSLFAILFFTFVNASQVVAGPWGLAAGLGAWITATHIRGAQIQSQEKNIQSQLHTQSRRVHNNGFLYLTLVPTSSETAQAYLACNEALVTDKSTCVITPEKDARVLIGEVRMTYQRRKPANAEEARRCLNNTLNLCTNQAASDLDADQTRFKQNEKKYVDLQGLANQLTSASEARNAAAKNSPIHVIVPGFAETLTLSYNR